ncbi:MAG: folylpolyglutamate synthase/dihydrofolate synthase family protein [Vicinamibacteria bacterium]
MPDRNARLRHALRYLTARARFGMKFGLDAMRALVAELGHPERSYPTLLIAGTNGKGSVAAYMAEALRASGLRVGLYTSPHLVRVNERIAVDGRPIGDAALASAIERVRAAAGRLVERRVLPAHPTHFEVITAAAFLHFRRRRVEAAVLEVGLGGRLDATNVAEPLASAIVSIAFDHEAHLGHTLARIAREKAGVMRRGRPCVLGPVPAQARRAIEAAARSLGTRLIRAEAGVRVEASAGAALGSVAVDDRRLVGASAALRVVTPANRYDGLRPLPGRHQVTNAIVALRLLEAAREAGLPVDLARAGAAFSRVRWPGRLQWIPGAPALLLDGAHNPAGARALAAHLRARAAALGPFVLVFGVMADKHVRALARLLFPLAQAVVLTRPPLPRACPPAEIARRVGRLAAGAQQRATTAAALALARRLAGPAGLIVVAGSLYLVGEVLALEQARRKRTPRRAQAAGPRSRKHHGNRGVRSKRSQRKK